MRTAERLYLVLQLVWVPIKGDCSARGVHDAMLSYHVPPLRLPSETLWPQYY